LFFGGGERDQHYIDCGAHPLQFTAPGASRAPHLEVDDAGGTVAHAGANAVRAGVATADDDDLLARSADVLAVLQATVEGRGLR
jgi:hypothetical protein